MNDNLTIIFLLAPGQTPDGHRAEHLTAFVRHEPVTARIDLSREDLGVGTLLNDPEIAGVHVTWLDDYDDNQEPVLAVTGTHRFAAWGSADAQPAVQIMASAVNVPYYPDGTQIVEWIAQYMRDNVYHDGMDANA
jgi:hypothetical protein